MQFAIVLGTLAIIYREVAAQRLGTSVTVYEFANYQGEQVDVENLEQYPIGYFFWTFNDKTSSFKIQRGTCVEIYNNFQLDNDMFWTPIPDYYFVGSAWDNKISKVKSCGTYTRDMRCPFGSFIEKVSWDSDNLLTGGIQFNCVDLRTGISTTVRSHGGDRPLSSSFECPTMIFGIQFTRDFVKDADIGMEPLCNFEPIRPNIITCPQGYTLSGIQLEIENNTGFIKDLVRNACTFLGIGRGRSALDLGNASNLTLEKEFQIPQNESGFTDD